MTYIDEHERTFAVESICQTLLPRGWPIASITYRAAYQRLPSARSGHDACSDSSLGPQVVYPDAMDDVWAQNALAGISWSREDGLLGRYLGASTTLWVPKSAVTSRGLRVFVDEPAESVSSEDMDVRAGRGVGGSGRRGAAWPSQRSGPMIVVVIDVFGDSVAKLSLVDDQSPVQ